MCYVLSSTAGATTITVTASANLSGNWVAEFREYSVTGTPAFDTAGNVDDSSNCTSCSGVTLSLGGTNDLIVQMINPYGSASAVSAGWGDADFPSNYFGVADELATASGAPPSWTTSSGHATGSALAFNLGASSGGGYTLAVGPTTVGSGVLGGAITQSIYYVTNIKGGANTVTVTFNQSASYPDVRVLEYSGLDASTPLDVTAAANGNGTAASSGSATTSSANELIFGANTVYTSTKSAGTGFTSRVITPDGDIAEDENVTSTGSYSVTATLNSSGNWVMQMATFKAAITSGTSVYADVAYAPFGEAYVPSGASDLSFTGQNQDTASGLYDFLFREYHPTQGRWISPDPAGLAAVDPMNPQTWNRYAYVGGNPLGNTDPQGLDFSDAIGCTVECGGGGVFAAPNFFQSQMDASNSSVDLSFGRWVDWNDRQTFGDKYYDLPGHNNPVQQALGQYLAQVNLAFAQANAANSGSSKRPYLSVTSDNCSATGRDINYELNDARGYVWEVLTYSNGSVANNTESATLNGYPDFISIWGTHSPISQRFVMSVSFPKPGAKGTPLKIQQNIGGWNVLLDSQVIQRTNDNIYVASKGCPQ